jgi:hypothetical protein
VVTNWLRRNGVLAYYFVGDSSMGPTRAYIDPDDMHGRPWAFPVSANGDVASFEEAVRNKFSESQMSAWLEAMTGFTVRQREVRLVYFHPPGVYFYQNTARQWLEQTQQLREQGVFRWYTMTQLALSDPTRTDRLAGLARRRCQTAVDHGQRPTIRHRCNIKAGCCPRRRRGQCCSVALPA